MTSFAASNYTGLKHIHALVAEQLAEIFATKGAELTPAVTAEAAAKLNAETIFGLVQVPASSKNGHATIPMPVLLKAGDLKGNPAQFAASVAKISTRDLKGNPAQFAASVAKIFTVGELITKVEQAAIYLNFHANQDFLTSSVLSAVLQQTDNYGSNGGQLGLGKKIVVEYSSPNIAKPFHAGHLRSTIIGNFIANVHRMLGYEVVRINYLGDWGKQFGLLAVGFEKYGSEEALNENPIIHLFDVYVKINVRCSEEATNDATIHDQARAYFQRMENGDESALAIWKRFRDLSITKYIDIYKRLGIEFDVYSGESQYSESMKDALAELKEKNLLTESLGAQIIELKDKKLGHVIVEKSDGTTLYITRDIAAGIERFNTYNYDQQFYVVAAQQDLHFQQLFEIFRRMGRENISEKCQHINFGMVKGMSTRKGTVVFLEDILKEAAETMHTVMKGNEEKYKQIEDPDAIADILGISAVMIQDMSSRRIRGYDFDWRRITSFEGDTGPYLQYTHARICSIQRRLSAVLSLEKDIYAADAAIDFSLLTEPAAHALVDLMATYHDVLLAACKTSEPCGVVTFALELSRAISSALDTLRVIDQEPAVQRARAALFIAARHTLSNALRILGLTPVEQM
ncbi:arginyl-tRNA synthetase [Fonticula alba]|uniref:arginine--tRNA ligase n=1 Tax=Fonticula alba TaxID=691883 RepID=A0A058ZFU3_FONAL|nr:arginyl-tRNA synthetase [Fonticula alba]KCV72342.1 arginyl-tRNA synthetase [Fonticula alba]|eukprot:XP_009493920.1 arginyl-tRNA synthetase [Fonticula alba]